MRQEPAPPAEHRPKLVVFLLQLVSVGVDVTRSIHFRSLERRSAAVAGSDCGASLRELLPLLLLLLRVLRLNLLHREPRGLDGPLAEEEGIAAGRGCGPGAFGFGSGELGRGDEGPVRRRGFAEDRTRGRPVNGEGSGMEVGKMVRERERERRDECGEDFGRH